MKIYIFVILQLALYISSSSGEIRTKEVLCENNDLPCGGWGCYNTETETCHHFGQDRKKCKKTESVCRKYGYGDCYDKATHVCLEVDGQWGATVVVCLIGQELCYENCYDPNNFVCENRTICPKGFKTCGTGKEFVCYDPSKKQCSSGKLCDIQEKACDGTCYPANVNKKCFRIHYNYPWDEVKSYDTLW